MAWWVWVLLGLGLLVVEVLTPGGFFVFFFGVGAVIVGALVGLGMGGPAWLPWLLFSGLSIGSLLVFRQPLVRWLRADESSAPVDALVGEVAILVDDLTPGAVGKAELRGSVWTVRSVVRQPLHRGQRCRVERVEGLMLIVREE
jgi:hypothetical protein